VIATATIERLKSNHGNRMDWFSEEIGTMFSLVQVGEMTLQEERELLKSPYLNLTSRAKFVP
jgi:hypothetical protein